MILKPLQRIQIIDSNKMCKAGSLGYFIAQESVGRYSAWNMSILFTRFGKAGKPRLYPLPVNTFMVDYGIYNKADRSIIDIVKFYDSIEPRSNIDKGITLLKPIAMEHKNLLDLSDNEFTAYIIALSIFIRKLARPGSITSLHHMPRLSFGKFVDSGFDFASVNSEHVGYYILYGLRLREDEKKIGIAGNRGELFVESYAERINNRAGRRELLSKLHMSLAMSKNAFMKYNKRVFGCFDATTSKINDILEYYRRNKKRLAAIKNEEDRRSKIIPNKDARVPIRKGRPRPRRKLA